MQRFKLWGNVRLVGWRVMVTGCDEDPMVDRQKEHMKMLVVKGVQIMSQFSEAIML